MVVLRALCAGNILKVAIPGHLLRCVSPSTGALSCDEEACIALDWVGEKGTV